LSVYNYLVVSDRANRIPIKVITVVHHGARDVEVLLRVYQRRTPVPHG
jgi:hypothetical protein